MQTAHAPPSDSLYLGIDFGTTNTVVSVCDGSGVTRTLLFPSEHGLLPAFRTILCYVAEDPDGLDAATSVHCGPAAIEAFLRHGEDARLIQSIKTFLASQGFSKSNIHGRDYTLEEIVADFLRGLARAAQWTPGKMDFAAPITVGRPVRFAGGGCDDGDELAQTRLRNAFAAAGFKQIEFALEPEAAAYFFARRLREPATVLVADFGGGTSDFSIVTFDPASGATHALAHAGDDSVGGRLRRAEIIDTLEPDHRRDAGQGDHVAIEP